MILSNARILTMDAGNPEIPRGWIEIRGASIVALGMGGAPPGPARDMGGDLLMPGMVNAHAHLAMTLFRGLAEEVDDRLIRYILPLERAAVDAGFVEAGTRLAALEMIRGGVTCVADMYYFEDRVAAVLGEAGLRGLVGQTLMAGGAADHATLDEGFGRLDALAEHCAGNPRIHPSAAPHAPYTVGMDGMARVARWAEAHPGFIVQMHLAETEGEDAWARAEAGGSPVEAADRAGLLTPSLLAAHLVRAGEADLDLVAARGVRVAHNPRSNAKAGRPVAPVEALRARKVPVGLATDGPMSGNTLDVFAQLAPAVMLARIRAGTRGALPPRAALRMATIEGAAALGLADRIGSLEPGKEADLIRVSLADPRLHPIHDLPSALVFAALPSDVVGTMVAGHWLMEDRAVLSVDPARALADALQLARRLDARVREIDRAVRAPRPEKVAP